MQLRYTDGIPARYTCGFGGPLAVQLRYADEIAARYTCGFGGPNPHVYLAAIPYLPSLYSLGSNGLHEVHRRPTCGTVEGQQLRIRGAVVMHIAGGY